MKLPRPVAKSRSTVALPILVMTGALLIDAATKWIAENLLSGGNQIYFLNGVITLRILFNHGAALGIGSSQPLLISVAVILVTIGIILWAFKSRDPIVRVLLSLVAGGSLGNLIDRIFRPPSILHGAVIDWISLFHQNIVFNLADVEIRVSLLVLVIYVLAAKDRIRLAAHKGEVDVSSNS